MFDIIFGPLHGVVRSSKHEYHKKHARGDIP